MRRRLAVMLRNDLFCDSRHLGIGKIRKVQIRLLIFHEIKVECSSAALVACVGAYHRKSAHQSRCMSSCIQAKRRLYGAISAASSLHQEVAIPFLWHGQSEIIPEFFSSNSEAAIDYA